MGHGIDLSIGGEAAGPVGNMFKHCAAWKPQSLSKQHVRFVCCGIFLAGPQRAVLDLSIFGGGGGFGNAC